MKIDIPNATVSAGREFELELDDQGGAMVAIKVEIFQGDNPQKTIFHAQTIKGPKTEPVQLSPGDYDCFVTIGASRSQRSLGTTYRSSVTMIDGAGGRTVLCSAKGSVPKTRPSDVDSDQLTLTVS
jgi:hypothetical protein